MNNTTGVPKRELELTELLHEVVDEALREHRELVRLRAEKLGGGLIDGLTERLTECGDCEVKA